MVDLLPGTLMWLLAGFSSLKVVGMGPQLLMSCWQEASLSSLPRGPDHRASHTWQLASSGEQARGQERVPARESVLARHGHNVLQPNLERDTSSLLTYSICQKHITRSSLHSRGEVTHEYQKVRIRFYYSLKFCHHSLVLPAFELYVNGTIHYVLFWVCVCVCAWPLFTLDFSLNYCSQILPNLWSYNGVQLCFLKGLNIFA